MGAVNSYFVGELQEVSQYTPNDTQTEGPGQEPGLQTPGSFCPILLSLHPVFCAMRHLPYNTFGEHAV